jgi:hypothetical protein
LLPTPFASFPFTSPPVRQRVPSHFNWPLLMGRVYTPIHIHSFLQPITNLCLPLQATVCVTQHTQLSPGDTRSATPHG